MTSVLPDMDFETYSEAGYVWNEVKQKWDSLSKSPPHGLGAVGASAYSEHPSTEILSLAWDLKDGLGPRQWLPGMEPPYELFNHIAQGEVLEAWNSSFEYYIWTNVGTARLGWPALPYYQLRDGMAKAAAFSILTKLEKAAEIMGTANQKLKDGKRLITKFCKPRKPTKKDPRRRIRPEEDLQDANNLYIYNIGDIKAEADVSTSLPDLSPSELELWLLDQCINFRGVHIDGEGLSNCKEIVRQATERGTAELVALTGGRVGSIGEIKKLTEWIFEQGVRMYDMTADSVTEALDDWSYPDEPHFRAAKRALELRSTLGSASVKKLFAMDRRLSRDGRLRDLFAYYGADRTGRFAGRGPQPQNLPASGPMVHRCTCGRHYGTHRPTCPWCGASASSAPIVEWSPEAVEDALVVIATRSLAQVEAVFEDPIEVVSACLRGLFTAAPGCELICSDFSAIEAVVLAELAGEEWRLEVFRTHGKIYEMSAAKITGVPFEDFLKHKEETGDHHPLRKKVGKVAELASGYQGSVGAWKAFGADKHMKDDAEIKAAVDAWRAESPNIVRYWYNLQDAAIAAVSNPGTRCEHRGITYYMEPGVDVLFCQLLSGRRLCYQAPRLYPETTPWGKPVLKLTYMGRDTVTRQWVRLDTYGGKLCENVVQATARDILTDAMKRTERAGYSTVLHIHDEIAAEVVAGTGSIEEFEHLMGTMPDWAADWPIKAAGGWRGKRYRKD